MKTAAQHAKTLGSDQLYCRTVRHPWTDSTVDEASKIEWIVRQTCPNCSSVSEFVVSAATGRLLKRRRMVAYGPGYLNVGGGYPDVDDRGAYRLAWLAALRKGGRK